ncbi:hypothetical protein LCGC14_0517170 [marine sediment metagenome]|uniref:Uncharacterized protein n=1 Tax=marine sediment metagenome TaxID=412755 RepID=A0A0F9V7W0_9ZZZZ
MSEFERMAECCPEKKHEAKGLCKPCYNKEYWSRDKRGGNVKPKCHPEETHEGRGLCLKCYSYERRRGNLSKHPITLPLGGIIPKCHPDKKHAALFLCEACYSKLKLSRFTPKQREAKNKRERERRARYRDNNPEGFKRKGRLYWQANKEKIAAQRKTRKEANPEKHFATRRLWRKSPKGKAARLKENIRRNERGRLRAGSPLDLLKARRMNILIYKAIVNPALPENMVELAALAEEIQNE